MSHPRINAVEIGQTLFSQAGIGDSMLGPSCLIEVANHVLAQMQTVPFTLCIEHLFP